MADFGELKKVPLREMWPNEAHNFTPWLADNIEALGNALGFDLELKGREASVGDFSLDLLAEDLSTQRKVIIENQLTSTDHDHLGKLITYASGFNASTIIWVAETIRDEHRQALEWLNQRTDTETQFFAVVVEVLRIDESKPAYNFKPIVFPNEWQKSKTRTSNTNNNTSSRGEEYRSYYQPLIDELREKHRFTNVRKAQPQNWCAFSSGIRGVNYSAVFGMGSIPRVEVYIDQGNKENNKQLFDTLKTKEQTIQEQYGEDEYGDGWEWFRLDEKKACVIQLKGYGRARLSEMTEEEIDEVRQWHISNLLKMKEVFTPLLEQALQGQ